jgi:hypothetical protein
MRFLRPLMSKLYYLPFGSVIFILALDAWSLLRVSPFRPGNDWLWSVLWSNKEYGELAWIAFWWIIGLVLAIPTLFLCRRISEFANSTEVVLGQYLALIENEARAQGSTAGGVREPRSTDAEQAG